jgi:hypothetical protein
MVRYYRWGKETTMGKAKSGWSPVWRVLLVLVALGLVAGCATLNRNQEGDVIVKTVWKSREQYLQIVKQAPPAGHSIPPNAHPADIPADRLRNALESIETRLPGKEKLLPLFNDAELVVLSENIHEALAAAAPDEDITFAVIGDFPVLMGIVKEPMVTTGRVFCADGRINIIFGDVVRYLKPNEDRRLYPFVSGSRFKETTSSWTLSAKPGAETFAMKRGDWITFPLVSPAMPASSATPAAASRTVTPVPAATSPSQSQTAAPAPVTTSPVPAAPGKKSVGERLSTLNELRDKKLITDEEYRAKRLEILNEL